MRRWIIFVVAGLLAAGGRARGGSLIDVACTGGAATAQTGFAATGISANDFWNAFGASSTFTNLLYTDGMPSGVSLTVSSWEGPYGFAGADPMMSLYIYNAPTLSATLDGLPAGVYDIYVYGHGNVDNQGCAFELSVGSGNYDGLTTGAAGWNTTNWIPGAQYVEFTNVIISGGQPASINITPAQGNWFGDLSGLQIQFSALLNTGTPIIAPVLTNQYVMAGSNCLWSVQATGAEPLSYQWLLNGKAISGATSSSLAISNAQPANGGLYSVVVSNAFGAVTSPARALDVIVPPSWLLNVAFPAGKEGFAATGITSNDVWNVDTSSPPARFLLSDGTISDTGLSQVTNAAETLSIEAPDVLEQSCLASTFNSMTFSITNLPAGSYSFYLYGHGQDDDENTAFQLTAGSHNYGAKSTLAGAGWTSAYWQAGVQFVEFDNVPVTAGENVLVTAGLGDAASAYLSGMQIAGLTPWRQEPFFLSQPASQTVAPGSSALLSVTVGGTPPFSYQWYFNSNLIAGATNSSYATPLIFATNTGSYTVLASNVAGVTQSAVATLSVQPPSIATWSADPALYECGLVASIIPPLTGVTVWFEWGANTNYGEVTAPISIGSSAVTVTNVITGLTPYTTYHYQAVASNASGVIYGGGCEFHDGSEICAGGDEHGLDGDGFVIGWSRPGGDKGRSRLCFDQFWGVFSPDGSNRIGVWRFRRWVGG